ncbi:MAG: hypothetical protein KDB32_02930 [Planctomycetes bacterium]|nr:hypothetical protein [Planctomycetota bacterium]
MNFELHLCPCCAAHLRVPQSLNAMRCNNCDAELLMLNEGGVRGLALLPNVDHIVPYSDPRQRTDHVAFDARELLESRRLLILEDAQRKHSRWVGLFFGCLILLIGTATAGAIGANTVLHGDAANIQAGAAFFLLALTFAPLIAYTAVYFHGRAQLVRASVRRWL